MKRLAWDGVKSINWGFRQENSMTEQTMEQKRAKYAFEQINQLREMGDHNEITSYASSLPAMIHINGLGQAMAFCKAKGGSYELHYQILSRWLCAEGQPYAGTNDLLQGITQHNMNKYHLAQVEALALMSWIKKFAKALLDQH